MTAPVEPRIVAEIGGLVIAERGPLVVIVDRGTGPLATGAFVLGVLALVFGGFGAVSLMIPASVPWCLGAIFLVVGIAFAGFAVAALSRIRRARTRPLSGYRPVAVFDRARRVYADADGVVVAPLDHVRFQNRMQLASSSPSLVAVTPGGSRIIKRGNPFNGGIGNLDDILTAVVFSQPR
ncbi:MAG: hypothetical protein QOD90_5848 [Mycobacterium sp.]|jgi:membrane protein implicated in regulation of membrane protease activity|nr:hypothetical protein [Mycobacterium sp.]